MGSFDKLPMSRLETFRSMANQAGQTMYAGASLAASVGKEKATLVASVGKEKGLKVYSHAAVAASAGRSTLETRIKQVKSSSPFKKVKQRLWSKSDTQSEVDVAPVAFASTEKEYYKVDPSTVVKRSQSSRGPRNKKDARSTKHAPALTRSASNIETDTQRRRVSGGSTSAIAPPVSSPQEIEF
ncbi:hypothetical protein H310_12838 [Aphanomyces invadans]|uniref:Uncharacterized protein n=1 Tax=Aphanomyces invadans TaxID=157072 RepID=A0A024TFS1_9STRA|nr:hypothetical protein H310_12838 [Aphanomyces invadans]ETV93000.1 hypothetical protein H310_12838 [Aphanomyces invadans]|eukprot:XP_008878265.1 hypothetical protein H310_12838 [Aphanomyces invadans]